MHKEIVIFRPGTNGVLRRTERRSNVPYRLLIMLVWSMPVAMTLLSVTQQGIVASAIVAAVISGSVILFAPKAALVALPFFAFLSPVAGFLSVLGSPLLLSDLLFILLTIQCAVLFITNRMRIYVASFASLPILIASLFLLSSMVGVLSGTLNSWKPVLYLLQLTIVYLYTTTFANNEQTWSSVINAWLVATCLGALLLIHAYVMGNALSNFKYDLDTQISDLQGIDSLFRADYYYTGFHFALGISIVISILKLLFSKSARMVVVMVLPVLCAALLLMLAKTALISVAVAIVGVLILLFYMGRIGALKAFTFLGALAVVGYVLVSSALLGGIGDIQADLWIHRLFSVGTLGIRLEVYVQALTNWMSFPIQFVTGFGPDFLDNSGDVNISQQFKVSSVTGEAEGTVDSGWISYLIELGIVGFAALVMLILKSLGAVLKYLERMNGAGEHDTVAMYVLGGVLFMVVALSTQMLGYSKVAWLPFQLLIIGLMHKRYVAS